jgi:hypothetical protein
MCDESNDYGNDKCFVILVKVFDDNLGSTETRFLVVMLIVKEHSQLLKKIHTEFRSELKNDTLCLFLSCKFNQNHHCYEYAPSAEVLQSANCTVIMCFI